MAMVTSVICNSANLALTDTSNTLCDSLIWVELMLADVPDDVTAFTFVNSWRVSRSWKGVACVIVFIAFNSLVCCSLRGSSYICNLTIRIVQVMELKDSSTFRGSVFNG